MTSPSQSISSAPKIRSVAPFATSPPLIVEAHPISVPPSLTRTPPDTCAPPRTQKSPWLTTRPPVTVPEIVPVHSVAASAPPLQTASTNPAIPIRNPASFLIVPTPFLDFASPVSSPLYYGLRHLAVLSLQSPVRLYSLPTKAIGISVAHLRDRKSTRLNSSHLGISYAVFCLK